VILKDTRANLDLTGTEVTSIPADVKIGGKIIGLPRRTV
jgi:hypothetical protein